MQILPIQNFNIYNAHNIKYTPKAQHTNQLKSSALNATDSVHFKARITDRFPKDFLKDILMFGLPCPICNKDMIPLELLNEPAHQALKLFHNNVSEMTPINQVIFANLKHFAPKHKNKNIAELLQVMFPKAERNLISEQREILDELNFFSREIKNTSKAKELRKLISNTFEIIFSSGKNNRFKRKKVIESFDKFANTLYNEKQKKKIYTLIRELPTSENSVNAFVVKYAHRSPEEIGMKLHRKDFATLEHIIPDSRGGRLVIWECSEDNAERGNSPIWEQLKKHPEMTTNIQKHFDRLIEIYKLEFKATQPPARQALLKEYIFALKNEYAIASKGIINPDISKLGTIPAKMINREIIRIKEMGQTNYLKNLYKMLINETYKTKKHIDAILNEKTDLLDS